jgi:hypothetical protein
MSTEEHDFTIQVETTQSWYDGDSYANATLTFTSDGKSVKLEYDADGNGIGKIMPSMLKDIEACIDDPYEWIAEAIKQGPESIEKLREYEQELAETKKNIAQHQNMISLESKRVLMYQKKVDELKERMKQ